MQLRGPETNLLRKGTSMRAFLGVLLTVLSSEMATSQTSTFRFTCGSFEGFRAQFAAHPRSPPQQRNRLVRAEDAVSGIKLELTHSVGQPIATVSYYGNQNTGGEIHTFQAARVSNSSDMISFTGVDPGDGSVNLLSLFPQQERLIWTVHINKIGPIDQIVLGKSFVGVCTAQKL